jgi:hypothetical protein
LNPRNRIFKPREESKAQTKQGEEKMNENEGLKAAEEQRSPEADEKQRQSTETAITLSCQRLATGNLIRLRCCNERSNHHQSQRHQRGTGALPNYCGISRGLLSSRRDKELEMFT